MYPATLLKSFISCNSWWKQLVVQKFGGFSKCSFTSFAESNSFASSFPVLITFIFLVWLFWKGLSILCWIKETIVRIFYSLSVLEEMLTVYHHWIYLLCVVMYVEVYFLYTHFVESFYLKWILNFVKWFLCLYCDHKMLFFISLHWWFMLISLHLLKHLCIPGINSTWSWCLDFLIYCWTQFSSILLEIFASM